MTRKIAVFFILFAFTALGQRTQAQTTSYNQHDSFGPNFFADGGTAYRSADGTPGPEYWQNRADYTVSAALDTASKKLSGMVTITYTNNSPHELRQLWLQMVQNANKTDSKAMAVFGYNSPDTGKNGFVLHKVLVKDGDTWRKADYTVYGTRMQIRLPEELKAKGASIQLKIDYDYKLPKQGRGGYLKTKNGTIYDVSYWYPRMCVYDDLRGWNILPFLRGGEFFLDYGTIDYSVTLPEGMLMAGSGKLMNPEQTLTQTERRHLEEARNSDKTVMIRPTADLNKPATAKGKNGKLTWHFHMENTRDVAWAASTAFMWDAARANLPDGKTTLAMSYYPVESQGAKAWGRATEYLKFSLEYFSKKWFTYPYPVAINVGGPVGGMEFPGITFDGWKAKGYSMFLLAAHEIGHNWFPMVVGSNERRNAWMDEGFNTFIDIYAHKEFNKGEYAPKRDGEYAPGGGNPAEEIIPHITKPGAQSIVSRADAITGAEGHPIEYFKTALGLVMLREIVLGQERFDYAFRRYIHDWAYKHPGAKDFFRAMNNYTGEELNWFWNGWFLHNWKLDQAITKVDFSDKGPRKEALITLQNNDKMVMPVLLSVTKANGQKEQFKLPAEVWMKGATYTFHVPADAPLKAVTIDAGHQLPDVNRNNNSWASGD